MTSRAQAVRRTDHRQRDPMSRRRSVVATMYAGLAMTVIAVLVPYVDRLTSNTLAQHIKAGYPTYTQTGIDTAANTYLVYLSVIGALGLLGWVWSIRIVKAGKRWARAAVTTLFAIALVVAVTDLLIKDTSGDTGLPHVLGWVGILPCLPGLLAVALLWRKPFGPRTPLTETGAQS